MVASLVLASPDYRASYVEALREGFRRGDRPPMDEAAILRVERDFSGFVQALTDRTGTVTTSAGEVIAKVPFDVFWLVEDGGFIGESSVRYTLNPLLRMIGGHVGYGIRPRYQRRGYGKLILNLALQRLRAHGIEHALVTCYDHNIASAKVIEANGGVLENLIDDPRGGGKSRRYWIDLGAPPPTDGRA